jgi:hypothetical protein
VARVRAILLAATVVVASACGGKVVLDVTGSTSSSSTGMGGAVTSSTNNAMGGFGETATFSSSVVTNDATVSTGFPPASTGDVMPGCGSFQISNDPMCQSCADGACCGQLQVCDNGTPCGNLLDCLMKCQTDVNCEAQCQMQFSAGLQNAEALESCYQASCSQTTPQCASGSSICTTGASTGNLLCDACLGVTCCQQITACLADAACTMCLMSSNPPTSCQENMLLNSLTQCFSQCSSQCGGG